MSEEIRAAVVMGYVPVRTLLLDLLTEAGIERVSLNLDLEGLIGDLSSGLLSEKPDVVLAELRSREDISRLKRFRFELPEAKVVVLSVTPKPEWAQEAIEVGIDGLIWLLEIGHKVVEAVRLAHEGRFVVTKTIYTLIEPLADKSTFERLSVFR